MLFIGLSFFLVTSALLLTGLLFVFEIDTRSVEVGTLLALGFKVQAADDLYREKGYLAGSDQRRAAELNEAFRDDEVAAIFPGTGGYGTTRILDRLDFPISPPCTSPFISARDW